MYRMVGTALILLGLFRSITAQSEPENKVWADLAELRESDDAELWTRDVNCLGGMNTPFDSSCWDALDINTFLNQWNKTAPICGPHSDGTSCCRPSNNPGESWSTCFLRMALGNSAGYNCDVINNKNCLLETFTPNPIINSSLIPQVRYVVRNIYAMNNFFTSWNTALNFAAGEAKDWVSDMINFLDAPQATNVAITDIFVSLVFGFAFLSMPGISKTFGMEIEQVITKALIIGIQQTPNTARSLWPQGTADSRLIQLGNVQSELGNVQDRLAAQINGGLTSIMSDVPSFLAFGSSGIYSNSTPPSLPAQTAELNIGFKTFLLTTIMGHNYWRGSWNDVPQGVSAGPDGDPSKQFGPIYRKCKYQSDGLCTGKNDWAGFVSPDSNRSYVIDQSNHKDRPTSLQMTQAIVDKQWSSLEFVMDGAFNCTMAAGLRPSQDKPIVEIGADGTLGLACMSQLPMIIQCQDVCPAPLASNAQCPFTKWDGCHKKSTS